jgi:hypothetical protein
MPVSAVLGLRTLKNSSSESRVRSFMDGLKMAEISSKL